MFGDSIQTKKQVKNIKESRKRVLKRLLIALFAAVMLAAAVSLVIVVAKPFKIRKIKVAAGDEIFAGDVYSVCEKYVGTDGFRMFPGGLKGVSDFFSGRLRAIENEIAFEFPQYENVRVKLSGGTLVVTGETRGAYILFENAGDSVVTDRSGVVVLICQTANLYSDAAGLQGFSEDAPAIAGVNITESVVSSRIKYRSDVPWSRLVELYFGIYADETLAENVLVIYAPGVKNVYFYCKNNVVVNFGSVAERQVTNGKLERLSAILRTDKIELKDGTINLSDSGRDTFRPNGGGPGEPDAETPSEIPLSTPGGWPAQTGDTGTPVPQETPRETPRETPMETQAPDGNGTETPGEETPAETEGQPSGTDGPENTGGPENTDGAEHETTPGGNGEEEGTPGGTEESGNTPEGGDAPEDGGTPGEGGHETDISAGTNGGEGA